MVDHVIDIPFPGRTLSGGFDGADGTPRLALPAFVAGPENRVLAVALEKLLPGENADPPAAGYAVLSIFGASGTGKTHLARGLVRSWHERYGRDCAEYLAASDFRHALREAIDADRVKEFRHRFRTRRLLAIDDLDRLPDDEYLQQELRYTLDAIADSGGLLVAVSNSAPGALRNFSADVRSRLVAGMVLRLAPPDYAARQQIVRHVTAAMGRPLAERAIGRLAAGIAGTANDLFGALFELQANSHRNGDDERRVEHYLAGRAAWRPTLQTILRAVGKHYGVPQKVLKSDTRRQSAVGARAMVVYLARELARMNYQQIGAALGGRDHTTMLYNYRKIADRADRDPATRGTIDQLTSELRDRV